MGNTTLDNLNQKLEELIKMNESLVQQLTDPALKEKFIEQMNSLKEKLSEKNEAPASDDAEKEEKSEKVENDDADDDDIDEEDDDIDDDIDDDDDNEVDDDDDDSSDYSDDSEIANLLVGVVAGAALVGGGILLHKLFTKN